MYRVAVVGTHPIQYFSPLYRHLAQDRRLDVTVYYCSHQGSEAYVDAGFGSEVRWDVPLLDGYKHVFLSNLWGSEDVGGFFSLLNIGISRELARTRPDAIFLPGHNHATFMLALAAGRMLGIPVIVRSSTHLALQRSMLKQVIRRPIMHALYQYAASACVAVGELSRQYYDYVGVSPERIFPFPNVVDNDYFIRRAEEVRSQRDMLRASHGIALDMPVLLYASKLTARKHPLDLLIAYREIRDQGRRASLAFVGSGPEEHALEDFVAAHNVPNVHFLGFKNQSELPGLYAMSDVFVLPSENEPWGLIVNEVMCAGLAVVTTGEIGAAADLVRDDFNGFTYKVGDVPALERILCTLVSDPDLRARMGKNSLDLIRNWNFDAAANGLVEAMEFLLPHHETHATASEMVS
jgi:glycosyltransferase involved in cell wall biosynthesis